MKRAFPRPVKILAIVFLVSMSVCIAGYVAIDIRPSLGAQGVDVLRKVVGNQPAAWLEDAVFQVQDAIRQLEYRLGSKPAAPWASAFSSAVSPSPSLTPETLSTGPATPLPENTATTPTVTRTPTLTATPMRWPPKTIQALGSVPGEGQWSPYFTDALGNMVSYRTFVQPDPTRPLTIAAIVAIDLAQTQLHYVLGKTEPQTDLTIYRTGIIPKEDRQPGVLLAVFNGGFQTQHGYYGVMVDGKTLIPMRDGLGALAIFQDGHVRIGVWGTDFTSFDGISVLRQNGPMIIQAGTINPLTNDDSPKYWGWTASGKSPTWRSAVGISADGKTLYYVVGESLTISALALALKAAGVDAAIQLDMNNYWILFCTVRFDNSVPTALPLLPDKMNDGVSRYLYSSARDYFYITAAAG